MNGGMNLSDRSERFQYEKGDFVMVKSQCKDCKFNENKPLSCEKYSRIPNGTRSGKIECPYKVKGGTKNEND